MAAPLSVVVCTLNEAAVIGRCLGSVAWADELLVMDSGSADATAEIARAHGARVVTQDWLGFSAQKNRAAEAAQHDWILSLDADEVVSPELAASIRQALSEPVLDPAVGFAVDRRGDFLGAVLPNTTRRRKRQGYVRLYNRTTSAWDEAMTVHEIVHVPGKPRMLRGILLHRNDLTIDEYVTLFNRYATLEADALAQRGERTTAFGVVVRPLLRFGWTYGIRGGFRLGARGLIHSAVKAMSDFIRYAKLWELQRSADDAGDTERVGRRAGR